MTAYRPRVQYLDGVDGPSGREIREAAANDLYLGSSGTSGLPPEGSLLSGWAARSAFHAVSAACCSASFLLLPMPCP